MKQNDWVIAKLNNPDFDVSDFQYVADMDLENTQLLPENYYVNNEYITNRPEFKDDSGQFSKDKFNTFYRSILPSFQEFSSEDHINNFEYSMFDIRRTKDDKVKDINFQLGERPNPEHNKIGIEGFNKVSNSDKSVREVSQSNKIYDYEKGEFLDYSLNDISLFSNPSEYFKSLYEEPLVYATYDEDVEEIDPYSGNTVLHKKGSFKLNDAGEYYIETLGGRSLHGKQVVSAADYLTSEDSSFNKYDFFDSDDLEKSISGNIAKNLVAILPMFIPVVGKAYSGIFVVRELAKSMPMLYGIATGLAGAEETESEILNKVSAYGQKFTTSVSDYAQQNMFSFENFAKLASDVVLQFGQQQQIVNTFTKLTGGGNKAINTAYSKAFNQYKEQTQKTIQDALSGKISYNQAVKGIGTSNLDNISEELIKTGKWMDTPFGKAAINQYLPKAQKIQQSRLNIGRNMALGYMALVSNTDVYETVLAKGATPQEAAAIALGSIIGMYSVDKFLGLGELFFQDEPARIALRETARREANLLRTAMGTTTNDLSSKKGIMGLIQKGINSGRDIIKNYNYSIKDKSLGVVGKAIGEGLEEVSEELAADLSKAGGELLGKLGYFSQEDYGAGENAFDRYMMSFLGGTMGGAIFGAKQLYDNRHFNSQDMQNDILYLLRQGKKQELIKEFDTLRKRGHLGSETLSFNTSEDGKTFLTAESKDESQAQKVYNTLIKTIDQFELILNSNDLNLSDDQLFDKMVQQEYRTVALKDFLNGDAENIKNISYITRYYEDYQKLINKITDVDSKIQKLYNTSADKEQHTDTFKQSLKQLQEEKEELLKERDFLFGKGSLGYVEKLLFAIDTNLIQNFVPVTLNQYIREKTGKSIDDLTKSELDTIKKEYDKYKINFKLTLDEAFKIFKHIQENVDPDLNLLKGVSEKEDALFKNQKLYPYNRLLQWNDKLETESDESFLFRDKHKEDETEEQFLKRREERIKSLNKYNSDKISDFVEEFSKGAIDASTFRRFVAQSRQLTQDLIKHIASNYDFLPIEIYDNSKAGVNLRKDIDNLKKKMFDVISNQELHKLSDEEISNLWDQFEKELTQVYATYLQNKNIHYDRNYLRQTDNEVNKTFISQVEFLIKQLELLNYSNQNVYDDLSQIESIEESTSEEQSVRNSENNAAIEEFKEKFLAIREKYKRNLPSDEFAKLDILLNNFISRNLNIDNYDDLDDAIYFINEEFNNLKERIKPKENLEIGNIFERFNIKFLSPEQEQRINDFLFSDPNLTILDKIEIYHQRINDLVDFINQQNEDEALYLGDVTSVIEKVQNGLISELYANSLLNSELLNETIKDPDNPEVEYLNPANYSIFNDYEDILQDVDTKYKVGQDSIFSQLRDNFYSFLYGSTENGEKIKDGLFDLKDFQSLIQIEQSGRNIKNPIVQVLSKLSSKLRGNNTIEQTLEEIYNQFVSFKGNYSQFQLSESQVQILEEILQDLNILAAVVYAAGHVPNTEQFVGHNRVLNDYAQRHKDLFKDFKELNVLDPNDSQFILYQIGQYQREIAQWIQVSSDNQSNKIKKLFETETAIVNTRLQFYKTNRVGYKLNPDIDLLEGYEKLEPELKEDLISLIKIENLIKYNFDRFTSEGKITIKDVLEHANDVIWKNINSVVNQSSVKLDENLNYNNLTDYDKFIIFVSTFAVDNFQFYEKLKTFINNNNLAPLMIQEYVAKISNAQLTNPELINQALDFINGKTGGNRVVLYNSSFTSGVAGSGKTDAVSRIIINKENSYVSGPTELQVDTLHQKFNESKPVSKEELFKLALGDNWEKIVNPIIIEDGKETFNSTYYDKVTIGPNQFLKLKLDTVKIQKIDSTPEQIIIDEITHFSTNELQILTEFAKLNKINLIFLGDTTQNGKFKDNFYYNINPEITVAWRTPKLSISLRDNNLQKIINLKSLLQMSELFGSATTQIEQIENYNKVKSEFFDNLTFQYYLDENEFYGELITDDISKDFLKILDKNSTIGVVGKEDSVYVKMFRDNGFKVEVFSPVKIQGREYDYVIIDEDWNLELNQNTDNNSIIANSIKLENWVKRLYTMISRSKEGTIIIDNNLSKFVKNIKTNMKGKPAPIQQYIGELKKNKLALIEQILALPKLNNISPTPESQETDPKIETKPVSNASNDNLDHEELKREIFDPIVTNDARDIQEKEDDNLNIALNDEIIPDIKGVPMRVYGNVSVSGLPYIKDSDFIQNTDDKITKDLGIVIRAEHGQVKKGIELHEKVLELFKLKSYILFNHHTDPNRYFYDKLPDIIRSTFSQENLRDIQYYINVENSNNTNHLIGLTSLDNDSSTIGKDKVVTLVAKIIGKDGKEYHLTLGGLSDPEKWKQESKNNKNSIRRRIKKISTSLENITEEDQKLKYTDTIAKLESYINNLDSYISQYENWIDDITSSEQQILLNEQDLVSSNGMTTLISAGRQLRLLDINSTPGEKAYSEFREKTKYSVKSNPEIIVGDINGVSPKVKGRAVIYGTSDLLLDVNDLGSEYLTQKSNPDQKTPAVRMVVLNNKGVSFNSLKFNRYQRIYETTNGSIKRMHPFNDKYMGIGMFISLWNFRANLIQFTEAYEVWRNNNFTDNAEVESILQEDNKYYNSIRESLATEENPKPYLSESDYRAKLQEYADNGTIDKDIFNKIKKIWEFNDSLKDHRQFRLGYESSNGAYIRKLTGLDNNSPYEGKDLSNIFGIYINPTLALQYRQVLESLFENVFDKMSELNNIGIDKKNIIEINKDIVTSDQEKVVNWYQSFVEKGKVSIKCVEDTPNFQQAKYVDIKFENPYIITDMLIEISRNLHIRAYDPDEFDKQSATRDKFKIKIERENEEDININYVRILDGLEGVVQTREGFPTESEKIPGVKVVQVSKGENQYLTIDKRLDNLFSLAFHGLISTKIENDFETDDMRSTDALFKYGFKTDPVLQGKDYSREEDRKSVPTVTNESLFTCDVTLGFPLLTVTISPKPKVGKKPKIELNEKSNLTPNDDSSENELEVVINETKSKLPDDLKDIAIYEGEKITKEEYFNKINERLDEKLRILMSKGSDISKDIFRRFGPQGTYHLHVSIFKSEQGLQLGYTDKFNSIIDQIHKVQGTRTYNVTLNSERKYQIYYDNIIQNYVIKEINTETVKVEEVENSETDKKKYTTESFLNELFSDEVISAINKQLNEDELFDKDMFITENIGISNKDEILTPESLQRLKAKVRNVLVNDYSLDLDEHKSLENMLDANNNSCE